MVLQISSMITQLSVLFVNDNPNCPVKTVTDKAYRQSQHLRPFCSDAKL